MAVMAHQVPIHWHTYTLTPRRSQPLAVESGAPNQPSRPIVLPCSPLGHWALPVLNDHPTNLHILPMLTPPTSSVNTGNERIAHPIIRGCAPFELTIGSTRRALPVSIVNSTAYRTFSQLTYPSSKTLRER